MGFWKQLTHRILTVRAFPANTAHSSNVGRSVNVADVGLTLKQLWANFSLEWYLVISSVADINIVKVYYIGYCRPIVVWGEGYHWRCQMFDKSMDVTNASGPIFIVVSCPVSKRWFTAETQSKWKIFLIHSLFIPYSCRHCQICVCYLVLCDRGRLSSHAAECVWRGYTSDFWEGHTWREPGGSADPSISDSVLLELGAMIC